MKKALEFPSMMQVCVPWQVYKTAEVFHVQFMVISFLFTCFIVFSKICSSFPNEYKLIRKVFTCTDNVQLILSSFNTRHTKHAVTILLKFRRYLYLLIVKLIHIHRIGHRDIVIRSISESELGRNTSTILIIFRCSLLCPFRR